MTEKTLQITLNGSLHPLESACTVAELLEQLGLQSQAVAVEVNGEVLDREEHRATVLAAGDRVEVVRLVGGG